MNLDDHVVDVIVVGGGPAGLSAATTLGRSRRRVLVVDAGEPRNAAAAGAHNLLSRDGIAPAELLRIGRREAESYGAEIVHGEVVAARRVGGLLEVETGGGQILRSRRLLLATGLVDALPDVPGVAELWGRSVLHCPYCHGWEVRDRRIGVLASGPNTVHQALLFRRLSDLVTVFTHTAPGLTSEEQEQLAAWDISVVDGAVERLDFTGDQVEAVVLADGTRVAVDAVIVAPRFQARTELYEQLGGSPTDHPMGRLIDTGFGGRTAVSGVYAIGNAADLAAMIVTSAAAGVTTAAMINADLVAEETEARVAGRREVFSPDEERQVS